VRTAALALRSVPRAALALPPVWRMRLAATLVLLAVVAAGYWLWFRDSSFARVKEVYVTGVDGPQARAIRNALEEAALSQSTLHVRTQDLRDAVSSYPVVRTVTAEGDFPHKLAIDVDLNLPVGILQTPSGRKPVAADGLLLPDVPISGGLPILKTKAALPTERLSEGKALALVRVVALAPEALRSRITEVLVKPSTGITIDIRKGPELRFGDSSRLPAKWMAAARVLAAAGARGASYIDLRLPERPAAGGLPTTSVLPLAPAGEGTVQTGPTPPSGAVENTQPQVQTSTQPSTMP
jgi:cell division protein FtsQ